VPDFENLQFLLMYLEFTSSYCIRLYLSHTLLSYDHFQLGKMITFRSRILETC